MPVPSGTESARPFLPAKNFDVSKSSYETLGFKKLLDGDVAIFAAGQTAFILQRLCDKKWAEYTMMQGMVDDLDRWRKSHRIARPAEKIRSAGHRSPLPCDCGDCELHISTTLRVSSGTSLNADKTRLRTEDRRVSLTLPGEHLMPLAICESPTAYSFAMTLTSG
jgi:hypothetical protein